MHNFTFCNCNTHGCLWEVIFLFYANMWPVPSIPSFTPYSVSVTFFSLPLQFPGHTRGVFPEETNQLQSAHQSQQSLLHFRRGWWNQSDPPYWLWEWSTSLPATGTRQWGPGQHEQRSRGGHFSSFFPGFYFLMITCQMQTLLPGSSSSLSFFKW